MFLYVIETFYRVFLESYLELESGKSHDRFRKYNEYDAPNIRFLS